MSKSMRFIAKKSEKLQLRAILIKKEYLSRMTLQQKALQLIVLKQEQHIIKLQTKNKH